MAEKTHNPTIGITIDVVTPFSTSLGIGNHLLIVDEVNHKNDTAASAENPVVEYSRSAVVRSNAVEGEWNNNGNGAILQKYAEAYFQQQPFASNILIGGQDVANGQNARDALDIIQSKNNNFYSVAARTLEKITSGTEKVDFATHVDQKAKPMAFFTQDPADSLVEQSDAETYESNNNQSGLTPSINTGTYSTYKDIKRMAIAYDPHAEGGDPTASPPDPVLQMRWPASFLAFDPGQTSAPAFQRIYSHTPNPEDWPSGTSVGSNKAPGNLRKNHVNAALAFGPATSFMKPGTTVYEMDNGNAMPLPFLISKDWFENEVEDAVASRIVGLADEGERLNPGPAGQSETQAQVDMKTILEDKFALGVRAGHFDSIDNTNIDMPTVTQTDVNNGNIPLDAQATLVIGGQEVDFNIEFTNTPL